MENVHQKGHPIMLGAILLILLILILLGGLPVYPYSESWGYGPTGIVGTLLCWSSS